MHDALIFNLTLFILALLTIVAMWVGLWAYFDRNIDDEDTGVKHEKRRNRS